VNRDADFVDIEGAGRDIRRMLSRGALKSKKSSTRGIGFSCVFYG
jgi:hypothetical protein